MEDLQLEYWHYALLVVGGFLAGIINTLAGNGSSITLTLMIVLGLPPTWANATNRIGVLLQTFTGVMALRRTKRTRMLFKRSVWYYVPALLGSTAGAFLAVDIPERVLQYIIGFLMLFLLFTLTLNPKKWKIRTDLGHAKQTWYNWILFFFVGVYAGFIQMGIGIVMLAALVLIAKYSLTDANILKLILAFILIVPSFFVFLSTGQINWPVGLSLAVGSASGAWFGTRRVLYHPKAGGIIRGLLIVILVVSVIKLLELPHWVAFLFQ